MKWLLTCIAVLLAGVLIFATMNNEEPIADATHTATDTAVTVYDVTIDPVEHASMVLTIGANVLYVDPVGGSEPYTSKASPTMILLTDIHGDHFNLDTLTAITVSTTAIVAPQAVYNQLPEILQQQTTVLANGENATLADISIEAIPMYNLPDQGVDIRHEKGRGNGYVLTHDGITTYIAGDTADIPEMRALSNIDIAFVPMNLPYTMSVSDAADAVIDFAPRTAIPYHYRTPEGLSDVSSFKEMVDAADVGTDVLLLNWYK